MHSVFKCYHGNTNLGACKKFRSSAAIPETLTQLQLGLAPHICTPWRCDASGLWGLGYILSFPQIPVGTVFMRGSDFHYYFLMGTRSKNIVLRDTIQKYIIIFLMGFLCATSLRGATLSLSMAILSYFILQSRITHTKAMHTLASNIASNENQRNSSQKCSNISHS